MLDSENETFDELEEHRRLEVIPSKEFLRIFGILAILASISGFFILFSIIAVSVANATILYPYGFIIGFLLLSGGLILLSGLIFLHQESRKTTGVNFPNTNEKKPIN